MTDFDSLVAEAAKLAREVRRVKSGGEARFEVYTFAPPGASICSEKVRCALLAKNMNFVERQLDYFKGTNYDPAYVRLRSLAEGQLIGKLEWDGSSSAAKHGVDPLVVPTLVDLERKVVVVDSRSIVEYIDQEDNALCTKDALVREHVELVDEFPHLTLLYGGGGEGVDRRPWFLRTTMKPKRWGAVQLSNQARYKAKAPEDLKERYDRKMAKTRLAWEQNVRPDSNQRASQAARQALAKLDVDIPNFDHTKVTAADIGWFITLYRLQLFGNLDVLAAGLHNIRPYFLRLLNIEALRGGVIYPTQVPSPYVTKLLFDHVGFKYAAINCVGLAVASTHVALSVLADNVKGAPIGIKLAAAAGAVGLATAGFVTIRRSGG